MTDSIQKRLQHILKEIDSIKTDREAESKLAHQILSSVIDFESGSKQNSPEDINSQHNSPLSIAAIIALSCCSDSLSLLDKLGSFPKLKLAVLFIDRFFDYIEHQSQLPQLLKHLIFQIRLPMLTMAIQQPNKVLHHKNTVFSLILELFDYAVIWKNESLIGFPTYNKLLHILSFENTNYTSLEQLFNDIQISIKQIKDNQQKRTFIFERRLRETENSQAKTRLANDVVNNLIAELLDNNELDHSVKSFIDETWRKLLQLEYVRSDEQAFFRAVETAIMLVASIQPLKNKRELNWLMNNLPSLSERLTEGFAKLAISDEDLDTFLSIIGAVHIHSLGHASKLGEIQIAEKESSTSEEIMRLKPNITLSSEPEINATDEQQQLIEPEEQLNQKSEYSILNLIENNLLSSKPAPPLSFSIKDINSEYSSINPTESNLTSKILKEKYQITIESWYTFVEEQKLNKLLLINKNNGEHIFVDQNAKKSHTLSSKELLEKLETQKIIKMQKPAAYMQAIDLSSQDYERYMLEYRLKQQQIKINEQTQIVFKKSTIENKSAQKKLETKANVSSDKTSLPSENPNVVNQKDLLTRKVPQHTTKYDIELLPIGSWVKISLNPDPQKCKLAARISSKDRYIFVSRKGEKLFEFDSEELNQYYKNGTLELVDIETTNEQTLASVISKTRILKSDL